MGAGQFGTNAGLVSAVEGSDLDAVVGAAAAAFGQSPAQQMLTLVIHSAFGRGVDALSGHDAVETLARGPEAEGANQAQAATLGAEAAAFAGYSAMGKEVFGSLSSVVRAVAEADERRVGRERGGTCDMRLAPD